MKKYEDLTKKEKITGFVVFLIVLLIGFNLLKPSNEVTAPSQTPTAAPTPTATVTPTPDVDFETEQVMRSAFIKGCEDSESRDFCSCAYMELRTKYEISELAEMGKDAESDQAQLALLQASAACMQYLEK